MSRYTFFESDLHESMMWWINKDDEPLHGEDTLREMQKLEKQQQSQALYIKRLEEALAIYADKEQWYVEEDNSPWSLLFDSSHMDGNGWQTAKEALEKRG